MPGPPSPICMLTARMAAALYAGHFDKLGIKSVATLKLNRMKNLEIGSEKGNEKENSRGSQVEKTTTVNGVDVYAVV
nr:unnamed protein product [Callosobruchus analis]